MTNEDHKQADGDTEAILRRRRFLIESALAGAGLGALLTGCEPLVCLKVAPPPTTKAPPKPKTETSAKACLSVPLNPQPCLEVMPPKPKTDTKPTTAVVPRPCLRLPAKPCLSVRRDR